MVLRMVIGTAEDDVNIPLITSQVKDLKRKVIVTLIEENVCSPYQ